jgi:sec-independent protein translocase protein TatA
MQMIEMALVGYELVIVAAIILIIIFWGPKKLPELARSIGLARKELKKATEEE